MKFITKLKKRLPPPSIFFTSVLALLLAFFSGYVTSSLTRGETNDEISAKLQFLTGQEDGKPQEVTFGRFWEAWRVVDNNFFGDTDKEERVNGAISGMLYSLGDPYTVYLPKEENELFQTDLAGEFSGIGAEISQINGLPTVVSPLPDSPAEKAGLKPKDIITKVDDLETSGEKFAKVINHIRGQQGTVVELTVVREGEAEEMTFSITREVIHLPSVAHEIREDKEITYGYLQISQFLDDTEKKVKKALEDFNKKDIDKIVVDVRNDPGGLLNVVIDVSSLFIDTSINPELNDVIVYQKDRNDQIVPYKSTRNNLLESEEIVLLINEGTASAAEIFAGALSDYGRAKLVGTKSFGKGSVQELKNLSDGSSVKVTTAKWLTPNQSEIDQIGIEPDLEVAEQKDEQTDANEEKDTVLQAALELLRN